VPALRVRRRSGVWPIVVGSSTARGQRLLAWLTRAFSVAVAAWLVAYAVAGPAAVGVIALPPSVADTALAAGWSLVGASLALLVLAQGQMGAAWRIGIDARATPLVTHGLYGVVRNPIYSAMDLVLAGVVLVAPSPWSLAAALGVAVALAVQTRLEEQHLLGLHGPTYRAYDARVGRFVPGLGRLR
ncbi:MAG TPA: isoprenylcysteine carboxylmethyltransferase family protein, partial [Polyangia bacterium]